MSKPHPTDNTLHRALHRLDVSFDSGETFQLPAEYLRVHSPSAEVQGHGPGQKVTVPGKREVAIKAVAPTGNYAVRIAFDDGHDSGIFTWDYLYRLGTQKDALWQEYLDRLAAAGKDRDQPMPGQQSGHSCGSGGCGGH